MKLLSRIVQSRISRSLLLSSSFGFLGWSYIAPSQAVGATQEPKPTSEQVTYFETKVRPVLAENCFGCHGKSDQSGGLRLDSRAAILKGGSSGPAIIVGDPNKSLLITSIHQTGALKMPVGGKLKPNEIADIEAWIKMGAPWPSDGKTTTEEKKPLWSLQPVRNPAVPKVANQKLVNNPIDAFIIAKLEANKQKPSPRADARTLLRRVTYDLTGLPPTTEEMEAFLADKSPQAYEKAVDRLLASPQYGERWARIWLDVARYADTKGYVFEEDRNYYNAYTYRDWVINAFNRDLPYDQFIIQQIAADRLPEVKDGDDKHALAALGFLTVGRRFLNSQQDIIDDRIDVMTRGLQGFTVACARCHDHKFDPVPAQDYYSLYAVFASSDEKEAPISEKAIRDPWEQYSQRVTDIETTGKALVSDQVRKLREKVKNPEQEKGVSAEIKAVLQGLREEQFPNNDQLPKLAKGFEPNKQAELQKLQGELEATKKAAPTKPEFAMSMFDRPNPGDGYVFKRGNPGLRGDPAPRRFLAALSAPGKEREHWTDGSGRLELAKSIASKENPLTARVFVNRVWQGHFGNGLVRTPSDFGNQGEKPSHPELLDYLASTFMENGWSIKKLHRLVVTSATYQQSSNVSTAMYNADPDNRYLGRMNRRRLDLEQMRDAFLVTSGSLNTKTVGGKSVDLWAPPYSGRRSVYGFVERQNLPSIFRTFDFASPDSTSPKRFMTTVPQQALFFMNSQFSVTQAELTSIRADIQGAKDNAQRVRRLYLLLFGRLPDAMEASIGEKYLNNPAKVITPNGVWSYGFGGYDSEKKQTSGFTPMKHFSQTGVHPTANFPDPQLGYLLLNQYGGHPGHDLSHAVIRRWTAPQNGKIRIEANFAHRQEQGDGVRGRIVSSREGLLGEWTVRHGATSTNLSSIVVQEGDTLDFITDPIGNDGFDSFEWSPNIQMIESGGVWSALANFGGPTREPLSRLALYIQALMMTNEFIFID